MVLSLFPPGKGTISWVPLSVCHGRPYNNVLFPSQVQTLCNQAPQFPNRKCRLSAQKQRSLPCFLAFMCAQSCLTPGNPMECSLPGFSVHGIFQARILEWVAISFSEDLPNAGIKPKSPELQTDSLPFEPPGKPC